MGLPRNLLAFFAFLAVGTAVNLFAVRLVPEREEGGGGVDGALAILLTLVTLGAPFVYVGHPFLRSLMAQILIVQSWRVIEIVRTPSTIGRRERVLRVLLVPYEFAFLERTPRRLPVRELLLSSLLLAVGIPAFIAASRLAPPGAPYWAGGWPRWIGTAAAGYFVMEGMTWQWVAILPLFGFRHRPYQRHPILSRSIAEFWGVRWSSVIHRWLRSNVYEPLARRGAPRTGITAAFLASGVLHAYIVWPSAGIVPALWMLAFFGLHGIAMIVERRLGLRRLPRPLARAFVIGVFAATVPLFMEAILQAIGL
jgi:Membrane bound O-acyl transferase family